MVARIKSRLWYVIACAVMGFGVGVIGSESTFGRLRPEAVQPLLYSVEVRNDDGDLLASPLLVGQDGQALHLDLSQSREDAPESAPLSMSLDLSPREDGPEQVCLGYKLSLDHGLNAGPNATHEGRVGLRLGEARSVQLSQNGEKLHLQLTVARVGTKAFDALMRARKVARPLT
ncbi:MAG: hypothetical protein JST92_14505 [Deltaproteobacteria bacterium]|nr:hypothetical protein [Deltaproteobacteria bacterium]